MAGVADNPTRERANLLFIHSDQHCAAVTGCYGDGVVHTPALDALAQHGGLFESAYCPSPLCVPSRMALLTGRHPSDIQVWTNDDILDSAIPTLAHALGAAGYRPTTIGRMHAIGPDQTHGYVERRVGDHGPNHVGGRPADHGMLQGTAGPHRVSLQLSGHGQSAYQVHDECVAADAVAWLEQYAIRRRAGVEREPFCLSVGFMLPHQPFVARQADYDRYAGKVPAPRNAPPREGELHPYLAWWRKVSGIEHVSDEETSRARTAYWALVDRLDALIGAILRALREHELDRNTLIIYTSDHGEQVGEHGLWWKQTFYEASIRVPLIMSWPGVLPEGFRCRNVVSQLDLTASLLDSLGAPALPNSPGRSLVPLLRGQRAQWDDMALAEFATDDGWVQRMIRRGDWKFVYYDGYEPQLYNLREDPDELHNRAGELSLRALREDLRRQVLQGWDPERIASRMRARRLDRELLAAWAQHTHPADVHRWPLLPEMDYLD